MEQLENEYYPCVCNGNIYEYRGYLIRLVKTSTSNSFYIMYTAVVAGSLKAAKKCIDVYLDSLERQSYPLYKDINRQPTVQTFKKATSEHTE